MVRWLAAHLRHNDTHFLATDQHGRNTDRTAGAGPRGTTYSGRIRSQHAGYWFLEKVYQARDTTSNMNALSAADDSVFHPCPSVVKKSWKTRRSPVPNGNDKNYSAGAPTLTRCGCLFTGERFIAWRGPGRFVLLKGFNLTVRPRLRFFSSRTALQDSLAPRSLMILVGRIVDISGA
jgi:hypothetical protein